MCMGLDSTKEEMRTNEEVFLDRGIATFAFDGPGQGEPEYDLPIRPDYEAPVAAVIDTLETRRDLDTSRLGLWGVSLGGYYAPRAAAFEPRVRACISLTGPFDFADAFGRQLFSFIQPAVRYSKLDNNHALAVIVLKNHIEYLVLIEKRHLIFDALLIQGLQDHMAGSVCCITGPVHGAFAEVAGMAAKTPLVNAPVLGAIERQASVLQIIYRLNCLLIRRRRVNIVQHGRRKNRCLAMPGLRLQ